LEPEKQRARETELELNREDNSVAGALDDHLKERAFGEEDGAIRWNLLRDSADPERYVEVFITESWPNI
jgi:hypothetical protein